MKPKLEELTEEEYKILLSLGMLWEFYPEATGNYLEDKKRKDKKNESK